MQTIISTSLAHGSAAESVEALIREVRANLGGNVPTLLVAFASTAQPLGEVTNRLADRFPETTILGASTAGEFTEKGDAKGAVVLFALTGDYKVFAGLGTGLRVNPEQAIEEAISGLPREVNGYPFQTGILLLDPLAGNGEEATLIASSLIGPEVRLAGGAAGDDLAMSATHVAHGRRAAEDAAVVALIFSRRPLGVGASHGHRALSRPLRITRASGNVVAEIEGRPAWEVWREHTRAHAAAQGIDVDALSKEAEGAFLLRYEAGLAAGAEELTIRAPLSRSEGELSFACGIAEGSVIRITESVASRQIDSAREAARRAVEQLEGQKPAGALVFDCICRKLILGDDFVKAVHGISDELGGAKIAGFETYGEIAMDVGDMSGFHNTTSVVLAFPVDGGEGAEIR
jgi:methyl-accepting chemotaxis protein